MFVAQVIGDRGCLKIVGGGEKEGEKEGKHEKRDGEALLCICSQILSITDKFYLTSVFTLHSSHFLSLKFSTPRCAFQFARNIKILINCFFVLLS